MITTNWQWQLCFHNSCQKRSNPLFQLRPNFNTAHLFFVLLRNLASFVSWGESNQNYLSDSGNKRRNEIRFLHINLIYCWLYFDNHFLNTCIWTVRLFSDLSCKMVVCPRNTRWKYLYDNTIISNKRWLVCFIWVYIH